jgi:hypothetical protein
VFDNVVAGAFQITFRAKMHVNDVFLFFKNHFWHQHIKTIQNVQTILNFNKKQNFKFFRNAGWTAFPNTSTCESNPCEQWSGYLQPQVFSLHFASIICLQESELNHAIIQSQDTFVRIDLSIISLLKLTWW